MVGAVNRVAAVLLGDFEAVPEKKPELNQVDHDYRFVEGFS